MHKFNKMIFFGMISSALFVTPLLSSCNSFISINDIKAKALPAVQSYTNIQYEKYQINKNTRILITNEMVATLGYAPKDININV
jgi:hypothetical protein